MSRLFQAVQTKVAATPLEQGRTHGQAQGLHQARQSIRQSGEGILVEGNFDVVVSDIILPRRSGVSLMEAIADRWPDIKVILVTGEPTVETAASAAKERNETRRSERNMDSLLSSVIPTRFAAL